MKIACLSTIFAIALAACGGPPPGGPATPPASETPALIASSLPCAGARLPITGACALADDALFGAVNPTRGLFDPKCVWRTNEVQVSDREALLFRDQDCSAVNWALTNYTYNGDVGLAAKRAGLGPDDSGIVALKLFPLKAGETAEAAALATLALAPAEQRSSCLIKPATRSDVQGPAFTLDPTEELQKELDTAAQGDIYNACGPYGFTDADIFWEARPSRALFHALGQDDPNWDPKSFTFYRKGADGVWRREESPA